MRSETGPAYRIHTPRLLLRCWEPADTAELLEVVAANLDHLRPYVPLAEGEPLPFPEKLKEVRKWRAEFDLDGMWTYAILDRENGRLVGSGGIMKRDFNTAAEVGGWFARDATGRGLSREAAAVLARAAIEVHGYTRVQGVCDCENHPSIGVMEKLGFTHEGTRRQLVDGARCDEMIWSLLSDEWPASPAASLAAECEAYDAIGNRLF